MAPSPTCSYPPLESKQIYTHLCRSPARYLRDFVAVLLAVLLRVAGEGVREGVLVGVREGVAGLVGVREGVAGPVGVREGVARPVGVREGVAVLEGVPVREGEGDVDAVAVGEAGGMHTPAVSAVVSASLRQRHEAHAGAPALLPNAVTVAQAAAAEQQQPPAHTLVAQSKGVAQAFPGDCNVQRPVRGAQEEQPRRASSRAQQEPPAHALEEQLELKEHSAPGGRPHTSAAPVSPLEAAPGAQPHTASVVGVAAVLL